MHIVARICFGKAAFDILDINAVQMTFINLLWLWKCSYFNQHWGVLCAVWTLMWIAEYFWWRDDLIKIKKKKNQGKNFIRIWIHFPWNFIFCGGFCFHLLIGKISDFGHSVFFKDLLRTSFSDSWICKNIFHLFVHARKWITCQILI